MKRAALLAVVGGLALVACGGGSDTDWRSQVGPNPPLPEPKQYLFPPFKVAPVVGWKANEAPVAPAGFRVDALARGLSNPRNLLALPNGDVLVVESKGPELEPALRPKDIVMAWAMARAHGGGEQRPTNQITLLRDTNGDGMPEARTVLMKGLNSPFGIAYADGALYVGATDAILRVPYTPGQTHVGGRPTVLTELPGGPIDHHWTKDLTLSPDGARLYVGIGSNSNITENGMEAEKGRAQIWEVDRRSGAARPYATGLRNPNGLRFFPGSGTLWAVVNERDELGPDLVPDYLTSVRPGGFYGWPYSYYGRHVDPRVRPQRPDLVARAISPDYALSSHVAPLGLAFAPGGAFVGEHGSWDRDHFNGYKVVFVPFANGRPSGRASDFLTGFLTADGKARGRPVGVTIDRTGALLVADDSGNAVWRVSRTG